MTTTPTTDSAIALGPELLGQTVVVIGGSSGIGLETARRARAEGAAVVLTGTNPERLQHAALECRTCDRSMGSNEQPPLKPVDC